MSRTSSNVNYNGQASLLYNICAILPEGEYAHAGNINILSSRDVTSIMEIINYSPLYPGN